MAQVNRRSFLIQSGAFLSASSLLSGASLAKARYDLSGSQSEAEYDLWIERSYGGEMPDMLISYLSNELNGLADTWKVKRVRLKTRADVERRIRYIRNKVRQMIGDFPERNSLEAVTVRTIQKSGFQIENIMFQSRSDFWVTGNLYIPIGRGPFPGIISPCGHYNLARMLPQYQAAYQSLVKSGFMVMAFDPIGEGERRYYWDPKTGSSPFGAWSATSEHSMPGQLQLLLGQNLTEYRVWDAMRAIDYLLTRPEVDHDKIGCVGHSGGGDMTDVVSVLDERIGCVVSLEGGMVNRWPQNYAMWQPISPSDVEQNLFPAALYGIDEVDIHTAIAPRPVLTAIEQYSSAFVQAANEVQERYRQLGAFDKFETIASDDPHSWSPKLRVAATDWFCRWFYNREGPRTERLWDIEPPENLRCTPDGSLRYSGKGKTIFDLIRHAQASLPQTHAPLETGVDLSEFQKRTRTEIREQLHIRKLHYALNVRRLVTTPREGYQIEKIQFISEPGVYVPVWVFVPNSSNRTTGKIPTILYVSDKPMSEIGMEFAGEEGSSLTHGVLDTLAREGNIVAAVSVRGIGETQPPHPASKSCEEFRQLFDLETAMTYMTWFMNRSLLGMRIEDVIRSIDYVSNRDDVDLTRLHAIGTGMGAMWCLYAAALDPRIRSLIFVHGLLSYQTLTESDEYLYGADVFVRNVLLHFDLPQVAAAIADRPLAIIQPKDSMKRTVASDVANNAYQLARNAYRAVGREDRFILEAGSGSLATPEHYGQILRSFDVS